MCCNVNAFSSVLGPSLAKYITTKQCRKVIQMYPKVNEERKELIKQLPFHLQLYLIREKNNLSVVY